MRTKAFFCTFNIYSYCSESKLHVCNYFFQELLVLIRKVVLKNYAALTNYLVFIFSSINGIFLNFLWLYGYCQTVIFLLMCICRYNTLYQRDYNRTD
jgi:hypothetical protein